MNWTTRDFTEWFERVFERTLAVAQAVPSDHIDWQPRQGEFSCGDIIRHIASSQVMNVARLHTGELHYPGHVAELGSTKSQSIHYLEQSHHQARQLLNEAGEDSLERLVHTNQGLISGWRVLVGMIEHEIHHRSQLCSYLSELGVEPPPLYGLYVEQLPA